MSINPVIRSLRPEEQDLATRGLFQTALSQGKQVKGSSIVLLCSQDKARPRALLFLIRQYLKHHGPSDTERKHVMNQALIEFVKQKHYDEPVHRLNKTIGFLRVYGANPLWKDDDGHDALFYAHLTGNHLILEALLRSCPTNPLRRIKTLFQKEQVHPSSREYMKNFLRHMRREFRSEQGFVEGRLYSPFMQIQQENV